MSKTFYCTRKWLNGENSRSTGSVACYDGETKFADGIDRDSFIEIADCGGKIRLHKCSDDTIHDFVEKLTLLRDETDAFINHLSNLELQKGGSNE